MIDISKVPEIVYFATYVALSDNRLYDREWYRIEKYIQKNGLDESVRNAAIDIIKGSDEKIPLDVVLSNLSKMSVEHRKKALFLAYKVALEDGEITKREEELFRSYRIRLGIEKRVSDAIYKEAVEAGRKLDEAPEGSNPLEERYNKTLFSERSYAKLIESISVNAAGDIAYTGERLEEISDLLNVYPGILQTEAGKVIRSENHLGNGDEKKKLNDFLSQLNEKLESSLKVQEEILKGLRGKQSASLRNYTISFMGRTKAGKSTLHSVLLGGINNDFIGKGSERTTRYNYVYDFRGLRIIDTPGIGAPGGGDDVNIAKEVLDESDLICYVVTSDSIQETEFNFLKELKERNKPVLILLNKKDNFLRSTKKKESFLENPLGWYESDGEDSIKGHIDRINTYVEINHDFHNYSIVPVHLLAARLALSETDPKVKEKLLEGSRIMEFLRTLSNTVSKYGLLLKSQTIYNSAAFHIKQQIDETKNQIASIEALKKEIAKNCDRGFAQIDSYGSKMRNELIDNFNSVFESFASEEVREFANDNFSSRKKDIKGEWNAFVKNSGIEERLKQSYEKVWEQYTSKVEDVLSDIEEDINFSIDFGELSKVKLGAVFDVKTLLSSIGAAAGIVGLFFVATPVGWVLLGVSAVMEVAGIFVKSKKKQIEESQLKLYDSLMLDLEDIRRKNLEKILTEYDSSRNRILEKTKSYYDVIEKSLGRILEKLNELLSAQERALDEINRAYAVRIAGFMTGSPEYDISNKAVLDRIGVEREFGKKLIIKDPGFFIQPARVLPSEISTYLQEQIEIETGRE